MIVIINYNTETCDKITIRAINKQQTFYSKEKCTHYEYTLQSFKWHQKVELYLLRREKALVKVLLQYQSHQYYKDF